MIPTFLSAAYPSERFYTEAEWEDYKERSKEEKERERLRTKYYLDKCFRILKERNTVKILFGQGDEQPEEMNG